MKTFPRSARLGLALALGIAGLLGARHLAFASDDGKWTVHSPANLRGDTSKMETIIEKRHVAIMASAGVRGIRPGDRVSC